MNNFTRGIIIGSIVGTALGAVSANNSVWMRKNIVKPSKNAIKKADMAMYEGKEKGRNRVTVYSLKPTN
mgnify:CR=1 FL=1